MEVTIKASPKEIAELLVEVEAQLGKNKKELVYKAVTEAVENPSNDFLKLLQSAKE